MMNLQCSEVFPHQQLTKNLKIWLNHQILYYHTLTYWLLGATIGNHGSQIDESFERIYFYNVHRVEYVTLGQME